MYRHLGGLNAVESGYKKLRIAPHFDSGLTSVEVSEETPYGKVSVNWQMAGKFVMVRAEIPANTSAVIELPGMEPVTVGSGSYHYLVTI